MHFATILCVQSSLAIQWQLLNSGLWQSSISAFRLVLCSSVVVVQTQYLGRMLHHLEQVHWRRRLVLLHPHAANHLWWFDGSIIVKLQQRQLPSYFNWMQLHDTTQFTRAYSEQIHTNYHYHNAEPIGCWPWQISTVFWCSQWQTYHITFNQTSHFQNEPILNSASHLIKYTYKVFNTRYSHCQQVLCHWWTLSTEASNL